MKITLNKASLVNLSNDDKIIPGELTPLVVGGKVDDNCGERCDPLLWRTDSQR